MPKPAVAFTVSPICRSCKVPMGRNYERLVWVCPLCGKEVATDRKAEVENDG